MYITKAYEFADSQEFNWEEYFEGESLESFLKCINYEELFYKLRDFFKENRFSMTFALSRAMSDLLEGMEICNPKILELGAATGFLTRWLLNKYGGKGILVDNCEASYNRFKSLAYENEQHIEYIIEDIFKLDRADKFDIACSFGLIEHFKDKAAVLEAHKKFVEPGGLIIILIPIDSILTRSFFELHPEMNLGYRELLTQNEFKNVLSDAGLEIIRMEKSSGYSYDFMAALCKIK